MHGLGHSCFTIQVLNELELGMLQINTWLWRKNSKEREAT